MAYSTTLTVLDTEGGGSNLLPVTARVWMTWAVAGTNHQDERGTFAGDVARDQSAALQINFPGDANFAYASRGAALSVQDTPRVANDTGWLFRSGEYAQDLPAEAIEIVTATRTFNNAEVAAMIPPLPFTADVGTATVVIALTPTLTAAGIAFTATGTTRATGVVIGFTYTGTLVILPSSDVRQPASEAVNIGLVTPTITFASGPSVLSGIEAARLNSLGVFVRREFLPRVRQSMESMLNAAIVANISRQLPGGALPAGIILSIRSARTTAGSGGGFVLEVRGALGAFGGVFNRLPPITVPTGGNRPCFVATAVHGADAPEVVLLRAWRDTVLVRNAVGRMFVRLYEAISPPLVRAIIRHPFLRRPARFLIVRPGVRLATRAHRLNDVPAASHRHRQQ